MPGVMQVEALAQTMAVYVAQQEGFGDRIGLFAAIEECRFKRVVQPGDRLTPGGHHGEARPPLRPGPGGRERRRRGRLRGDACRSSSRRKERSVEAPSPCSVTSTATSPRSRRRWPTRERHEPDRYRRHRRPGHERAAPGRGRRRACVDAGRAGASSSRATPTSPSPTSTSRPRSRGWRGAGGASGGRRVGARAARPTSSWTICAGCRPSGGCGRAIRWSLVCHGSPGSQTERPAGRPRPVGDGRAGDADGRAGHRLRPHPRRRRRASSAASSSSIRARAATPSTAIAGACWALLTFDDEVDRRRPSCSDRLRRPGRCRRSQRARSAPATSIVRPRSAPGRFVR